MDGVYVCVCLRYTVISFSNMQNDGLEVANKEIKQVVTERRAGLNPTDLLDGLGEFLVKKHLLKGAQPTSPVDYANLNKYRKVSMLV